MSEPEKFGTYLVYELLGKGGMATVHRAESQSAGGFRKRVALKRLLPHLLEEAEIVESFAREAKLAAHLRHANIAQTYDLGIRDGTYFIAMELVAGPTLRQIVRQCEDAAGAMPIPHVIEVLIQVCDALDYAHNLADEKGVPLGIVHRDVTPANVIVAGTGTVKLIDFGLAKVTSSRGTKTGILKGKLGYMAPEYTLGRLDHRADLFAVGVIAHELLTGRRLFDHANDYEIINMLREMPIQPPSRWNSRVTLPLDDIVMTALSRDPATRFQSALALRAALVSAARDLGLEHGRDELATWTEWAFTQQPRRDESGLSNLIQMLGDPSDPSGQRAITIDPEMMIEMTPTPTPLAELKTTVREVPTDAEFAKAAKAAAKASPSKRQIKPKTKTMPGVEPIAAKTKPPVKPSSVDRHTVGRGVMPIKDDSSLWPWVLLLVVLAAGGGVAVWFLFLRP